MPLIEDLLRDRNDLSPFLVHLTRRSETSSALENVMSIIENGGIDARTAFGFAASFEADLSLAGVSQKVVCLTETPLEYITMMLEDIPGRSVHFEPYGFLVTKPVARGVGCQPVWYTDMTPGAGRWPFSFAMKAVTEARERAIVDDVIHAGSLGEEPIFRITPFFETMGPMSNGLRKEFWWEREWRRRGDFPFTYEVLNSIALIAPESEHAVLGDWKAELAKPYERIPIIDAAWPVDRLRDAVSVLDTAFEHFTGRP